MPKTILSLPPEADLEDRAGWREQDGGFYSAERRVVLLVKTRLDDAVDGPSLSSATYPAGTKYNFSIKNVITSKNVESVQRTAELTISDRLSTELLSKQHFSTGASVTGPTMTFGQEASQRISSELSTAVKDALSVTTSFELQNTEEITRSIEVHDGLATAGALPFDVHLYLKLYEWHFDFYLVRLDQLTLEYKNKWYGLGLLDPVRRTVSSISDPKALPLFRLRLYEPIEGLSVAKGPHQPVVGIDDSMAVHVEPLIDPAPSFTLRDLTDLEELARLAFPKTTEERRVARRKAVHKKVAATAAKKVPAKMAAAKKTAPKKSAAKKTARKKSAPKKSAPKKSAAKKTAAKKAPTRKAN